MNNYRTVEQRLQPPVPPSPEERLKATEQTLQPLTPAQSQARQETAVDYLKRKLGTELGGQAGANSLLGQYVKQGESQLGGPPPPNLELSTRGSYFMPKNWDMPKATPDTLLNAAFPTVHTDVNDLAGPAGRSIAQHELGHAYHFYAAELNPELNTRLRTALTGLEANKPQELDAFFKSSADAMGPMYDPGVLRDHWKNYSDSEIVAYATVLYIQGRSQEVPMELRGIVGDFLSQKLFGYQVGHG